MQLRLSNLCPVFRLPTFNSPRVLLQLQVVGYGPGNAYPLSILLESYCNRSAHSLPRHRGVPFNSPRVLLQPSRCPGERPRSIRLSILLESYCNIQPRQTSSPTTFLSILLESYCNVRHDAHSLPGRAPFNSPRVLLQPARSSSRPTRARPFQFS